MIYQETDRPPTVFISYSTKDAPFVTNLATDLKHLNLGVWVSLWDIKVGESLVGRIQEGISDSDYVIAVISRHSVRSAWVQKELSTAIHRVLTGKLKAVLPLILEDCEIPPFLLETRYADFRSSYNIGFQELLGVIYPVKLLRDEAERIVARYKRLGHLIPAFFLPNAIAAIERRLVPLTTINYGSLFWGGIEHWCQHNIDNNITELDKWSQFAFLLNFASDRYNNTTGESGTYSIPWRFLTDEMREAFRWERLSVTDPSVLQLSPLAAGPSLRDIRFTNYGAITFSVAVIIGLNFGLLRQELKNRLPSTTQEKLSWGAHRYLSTESGWDSIIDVCSDLSDISPAMVLDMMGATRSKGLIGWVSKIANEISQNVSSNPTHSILQPRRGNALLMSLFHNTGSVDMRGVHFPNLDLNGADLSGLNLDGASFQSCSLRGTNLAACSLNGTKFDNCDITGVKGLTGGRLTSLKASPDGEFIAIGADNGIIITVDVNTYEHQTFRTGHKSFVRDVVWDVEGAVITASSDGSVRRRPRSGKTPVPELLVEWHALSWESCKLWHNLPHDYAVGELEARDMVMHFLRKKHPYSMTCVDISRTLDVLVFGTWGGVIGIINLKSGELELPNMPYANNYGKAHWDSVWQVRIGYNAPLIFSCGGTGDAHLRVWHLEKRGLLTQVLCEKEPRALQLATDDSTIFCAHAAGLVTKWSLRGQSFGRSNGNFVGDNDLLALGICEERRMIAVVDKGGWVTVLRSDTLESLDTKRAHRGWARGVAFCKGGSRLVTVGKDGQMKVYEVSDSGRLSELYHLAISMFQGRGIEMRGMKADDPGFLTEVVKAL